MSQGLTRLGGAFFEDLPPNVAGSFAMGLLASSATLAAAYPGSGAGKHGPVALAMLPAGGLFAPLQKHTALHLGLRTGFCGSLTTYASWMLQMVQMFVGGPPSRFGSEWPAALWGIYTNIALSMTALVMGQHLALALHTRLYAPPPPPSTASPQPDIPPSEKAAAIPAASGQVAIELQGEPKQRASPAVAGQKDAAGAPPGSGGGQKAAGRAWICSVVDAAVLIILLFLTAISLGYAIIEGKTAQVCIRQKRGRFP